MAATGYTFQDSANFAPTLPVLSASYTANFSLLETAFSASDGHTHNGQAGQGGLIAGFSTGSLGATGTTQGGAAQITADNTYVTSGSGSSRGVVLAGASISRPARIWNTASGPATLFVYPPSGTAYDGLATNEPILVPRNQCLQLYAMNSTWVVISKPSLSARMTLSADYTLPSTGNISIPWSSTVFDNGLMFNGGAPTRLTVPSGVRSVEVFLGLGFVVGSPQVWQSFIFMNGSYVSNQPIGYTVGTLTSGPLAVTAGDYFEIVLSATSGIQVSTTGAFFAMRSL